ncbi:hypothetical protein ScPMuIL_014736 [Solemya velum]
MKYIALGLASVYVGLPTLIYTNPWILNYFIFSHLMRWPLFVDFSQPQKLGLEATRNFYLQEVGGNRLGLWHVLPKSLSNKHQIPDDSKFEDHLSDGFPIILYLHGNANTRAASHRIQLYKLLQDMDYHVVALDYRGYGDSLGQPTEDGLVSDSGVVYRWIQQKRGKSPVFIWGHSLGTGVTVKLTSQLCKTGESPSGVVLEAPFNNILDAVRSIYLSQPYKIIPGFDKVFLDTVRKNDIHFASDESVKDVTSPMLMLHAEDDWIVPFALGQKLYKVALEERPPDSGPVEFVAFNSSYNYGHKYIYTAPELPRIIRNFISRNHGTD